MGDFALAWARTDRNEGIYSNDPVDPGGETYRGIARHHHPDWEGWDVLDAAKGRPGFPGSVHAALDAPVQAFYRREFWNRVRGDDLPQIIADEAFDTAVNMSPVRAVMFLQRSLNAIADGRWLPVVPDGACGPRTLAAVTACARHDDLWLLEAAMNDEQWAFYRSRMAADPRMKRFARGWRARSLARRAAPAVG